MWLFILVLLGFFLKNNVAAVTFSNASYSKCVIKSNGTSDSLMRYSGSPGQMVTACQSGGCTATNYGSDFNGTYFHCVCNLPDTIKSFPCDGKGVSFFDNPCNSVTTGTCKNMNSTYGCGTRADCSGSTNSTCCTSGASNWTVYTVKCIITKMSMPYAIPNYTWTAIAADTLANVCSLGDKCLDVNHNSNGSNNGTFTAEKFLRPGMCACGSYGGAYKICCSKTKNVGPVGCVQLYGDGLAPPEGGCPSGSTEMNVPTLARVNSNTIDPDWLQANCPTCTADTPKITACGTTLRTCTNGGTAGVGTTRVVAGKGIYDVWTCSGIDGTCPVLAANDIGCSSFKCGVTQACPSTCHVGAVYVDNGACGTTTCADNSGAAQACPSTCHTDTQYVNNGACGQTTCLPNAPANFNCASLGCHTTNVTGQPDGACGTKTCMSTCATACVGGICCLAKQTPPACHTTALTLPDGDCTTTVYPANNPANFDCASLGCHATDVDEPDGACGTKTCPKTPGVPGDDGACSDTVKSLDTATFCLVGSPYYDDTKDSDHNWISDDLTQYVWNCDGTAAKNCTGLKGAPRTGCHAGIDQDAWFQSQNGNVLASKKITNEIPPSCTTNCKTSFNTGGVGIVAAGSEIKKGDTGSADKTENFVGKNLVPNLYNYAYFYREYFGNKNIGTTFAGSKKWNGISAGIGSSGVIFVNGNLEIDGDVNTSNNFLMLIVNGKITVDGAVKTVNGILIANDVEAIDSSANQLVINGSVYGVNSVKFTRSYNPKLGNNNSPAVVVKYNANLVFNIPKEVSKKIVKWSID
jgi:hypothetical protein